MFNRSYLENAAILIPVCRCSVGEDCTGGGASGAPGDVTCRGPQAPYAITRMTRLSTDGSLNKLRQIILVITHRYFIGAHSRPDFFLQLEFAILVFFSRTENVF